MKAAFALLADTEIYNRVRKLAWEIHYKYHTGTAHCRLPPHISLKQPFQVSDLAALEAYMGELAGSITPLEVILTELQLNPIQFMEAELGLLWIDVEESAALRQLHNRINRELSERFGNTQAPYDGPDYHFHMTVMIGGKPIEVYRKAYADIPDKVWNLRYTVRNLGLFLYDEPSGPGEEYLAYKILPVGGLL